MERREHYEPEDIEALLHERGFDELLAEERAFILRHMSGREEYEAMRTLLHRAKSEEPGAEPLVADPAIREQLLIAFREHQTPAWNIWLNSVKAFLFPQQASAFWRPALAVAVLALIIGGVARIRSLTSGSATELAHLEEKKNKEVAAPDASPLAKEEKISALDAQTGAKVDLGAASLEPAPAQPPSTGDEALDGGLAELKRKWTAETPAEEQTVTLTEDLAVARDVQFNADASSGYFAADSLAVLDKDVVNYVEREELLSNASVANATGEVSRMDAAELSEVEIARTTGKNERGRAKEEVTADSRSLAQDGELIKLLEAAW